VENSNQTTNLQSKVLLPTVDSVCPCCNRKFQRYVPNPSPYFVVDERCILCIPNQVDKKQDIKETEVVYAYDKIAIYDRKVG
jgi:hypothetical protein